MPLFTNENKFKQQQQLQFQTNKDRGDYRSLKPTFTCVSETEDSFLDCSGDTSWLNEELIKSSKRKTRNRSKRIRSFNMSSASSPPKRINENDSQLDPRSNIETNMIFFN
uniref:CSON006763 protein n=1 Tax=Culicoides sonorensis TaxID=179676 RepID=A0A336MVW1_CULSO